jgi:hypothetical protein
MKISELIKQLNVIKEKHGDIPVKYSGEDGEEDKTIDFIEVEDGCDEGYVLLC